MKSSPSDAPNCRNSMNAPAPATRLSTIATARGTAGRSRAATATRVVRTTQFTGIALGASTDASGVVDFAGVRGAFMVNGEVWIGTYLPNAQMSILTLYAPYYTMALSAAILWAFCMRAAPATNCAVRCYLPKKIDERMKRAERTR